MPLFDAVGSGTPNGGLGQSGTVLLARFIRNPHRGDAVIATFFWRGSVNVVDSVTDFVTDAGSTRAGNSYQLVEYVTAGGNSMATYVATNVQNFPDTTSNPGLAVRAYLSAAVSDGGALVSGWSGIQAVASQAVGAHSSASGSGSTTTVADPGAIAIGAGALAYGVTMTTPNGLVGRAGPQGFTNLAVQSDAQIVDQADYAVPTSAGTVDPRWTWNFTQPNTWLATVIALNPSSTAPPGSMSATASTSGSDLDPNGYTVTVDQTTSQPVATNGGSATFTGLAAGSHTVSLSGVAPNCTASGGNTQTVTVPSGGTATASYTVTCTVATQAASGITPDVHIGTAGQQRTNILIKGFDAGNPRHGDALVATFFWNSATTTNIIDSVTDVVNDASFTRVGNTYRLVQFVHSGNMSMATYVATNIQNFPDTNQTPRLAVRADLRDTILNGGLQLSAWSGVASDLLQAIGASSSNSGSGATIVADPGPINIGAGALAYGVSLVSIAAPSTLTDAAPPNPQEWTRLNVLSDAFVLEESNFLVSASARSADPQWQRSFSQPSTWLATVLALNPGAAPTNQPPVAAFSSSCSALTCSFTNTSSDPDGSITANSWNFGDGQTSTAASPSHTYGAAGTYTVTLTVTDNQSATNSVSHTVTVTAANQAPVAAFSSSCSALTCSFTNTSSDPDGSISANSWNFGDGQTSTAASPSHTYGAAGTYTVTLTVTDNQSATNSVSHTVTVTAANQAPVASFTRSCNGLTCSFTSTSSDPDGSIASYSWTFGDGGTSAAANPSHTYAAGGTYTVTLRVTDNQGAQSTTASQSVTVTPPNQSPTANFTFSCSGLTCSFTSTSSDPDGSMASYSWTFGDGATSTSQNPSHTYAAGGGYTVTLTVTDNQGASSAPTSRTVGVTPPNQPPTASFTRSCSGLTCSFTSTSSDPDGSIIAYSWTFGDGATSTLQNPSHSYAAGGTYTVTLRVTDDQGAQSTTASQNVTVTPPNQSPTANFTFSCSALSCNFTSTSNDPDGSIASYAWTFGDGATSTLQNPSRAYGAGGTYTVSLRVTDNQGAQSTLTSKSVTVTPPNQAPTASFTRSCSGLTCTFTSTSSDPDGSIASYAWAFGDGTTSTLQNPSHAYGAGGTYTVTLRVTDNQGAQSTTASQSVTVTPPNQAPTASFTRSCSGLTCSFTSTSSDPDGSIASYSWTFGDGGTSTAANPSHSYTAGGTYTVTLRVTDNQGAQSTTASQNITVTPPNQPPTANFTSSCSALSCNFTSTSSDPDGTIASYSWTFGDGATSTAQNPSHAYASGGTYTVTLRVTDNQGAQSTTTSKTVTVTAPNTAPVVNAGSDQTAVTGLLYSSTQSFTDANGNGPWTYRIDWGDGSVSTGTRTTQGSFSVGHTYVIVLPRSFTITVTVTDAAGASASDTKIVQVLLL